MTKLDMKTPDFTDENIEKLAQLFPNIVTESKDEKGNIKKAIDFELLKQELSANIVDGNKERYSINWPGKREALLTANQPINKTLRPCEDESVDFENTGNLYIEGDNLEALKLLQESYLNKIKMIYIDPPYNTGKDFVYKDNFTQDKDEFLEDDGQKDEDGGRLVANLDSNGRYHSDWLSMMYPRLKLARNLLKDDGVIFISIDDNEVANLRKICDEIFGEDNFISEFAWRRTDNQSNIGNSAKVKEYILCYSKQKEKFKFNKMPLSEKAIAEYSYEDEYGKFRRKNILDKSRGKKTYKIKTPNGDILTGPWMIEESEFNELNAQGKIYWASGKMPYGKKYLQETNGQIISDWLPKEFGTNQRGSGEIDELFHKRAFDFPKPTQLIKTFTIIGTNKNDLILDFFSGSATTAHAVMQLNAEDGGERKYICVQIPELTDEKSEAYKAGYKNICEIGKERIRRAGKKIVDESGKKDLDIGFRVLKIDSLNMKDVYFTPNELTQQNLFESVENIKEDRNALDLLYGVMIDWGLELNANIQKRVISEKDVYFVDENLLIACFEDGIDEEFVNELAKISKDEDILKVVFKDSGFDKDETKDNVEQIFKQISPSTDIRAI